MEKLLIQKVAILKIWNNHLSPFISTIQHYEKKRDKFIKYYFSNNDT